MLTICHLYPDLLNLYGDRGNVLAFMQRCKWRGLPVQVKEVNLGQTAEFTEYDFLFIGGGSDRELALACADLQTRVDALRKAVENGLVVLAICGGYQLLGRYYKTTGGNEIVGLSLLDFYTEAGEQRLIGNVVIEAKLAGKKTKLVGFENHAGKTFLNGLEPLGSVLSGYGNNGRDSLEGARYKNVFCSYLHGPLLPKNPTLTDYLIALALAGKGYPTQLAELDDTIETQANQAMVERLLSSN